LKEASRCTIQVAGYVAFNHPLKSLALVIREAVAQVGDGVIGAAIGPESIGTIAERGFPYRFQDHAQGFLYNPIPNS
jgi:hypothetical protein